VLRQEAIENFVFPDEIKPKLMQISKLNIFTPHKIESAANCISYHQKTSMKRAIISFTKCVLIYSKLREKAQCK